MSHILLFFQHVCRNADFLSSIDVLIVDQMNALGMQNWEHFQVCISVQSGSLINTVLLVCTLKFEFTAQRNTGYGFLSHQTMVSGRLVSAS